MLLESAELPTSDQIRELIRNRPATVKLSEIANAVGMSESWLKKVLSGEIKNPPYDQLASIVRFFKSKQLPLI